MSPCQKYLPPAPAAAPRFATCCGPYLAGAAIPQTAEALMRSRYTAYTLRQRGLPARDLASEHPAGRAHRDTKTKDYSGWDLR